MQNCMSSVVIAHSHTQLARYHCYGNMEHFGNVCVHSTHLESYSIHKQNRNYMNIPQRQQQEVSPQAKTQLFNVIIAKYFLNCVLPIALVIVLLIP